MARYTVNVCHVLFLSQTHETHTNPSAVESIDLNVLALARVIALPDESRIKIVQESKRDVFKKYIQLGNVAAASIQPESPIYLGKLARIHRVCFARLLWLWPISFQYFHWNRSWECTVFLQRKRVISYSYTNSGDFTAPPTMCGFCIIFLILICFFIGWQLCCHTYKDLKYTCIRYSLCLFPLQTFCSSEVEHRKQHHGRRLQTWGIFRARRPLAGHRSALVSDWWVLSLVPCHSYWTRFRMWKCWVGEWFSRS